MNKIFNAFNTFILSLALMVTLFSSYGFRSLKMPPSTMISAVVDGGANPVPGATMQSIDAVSGTQFTCSGSCTSAAGGNINPDICHCGCYHFGDSNLSGLPAGFLPYADLWVGGKTTPINKTVSLSPTTATKLSVQFTMVLAYTYPIQINVLDLPANSSGAAPKTVMSQTSQKACDLQNFQAVAGHIYTICAESRFRQRADFEFTDFCG